MSAVSGDLVVKLALGVAVVGAVWYGLRQVRASLSDASDAAAEWASNTAAAGIEQATTDYMSPAAIALYGGPLNPIGRLIPGARSAYEYVRDKLASPASSGGATGSW